MPEFVLDPYAARSCPVKTQNAFLPGLQRPEADESLHEVFRGGQTFSHHVLTTVIEAAGDNVVDCRSLRDQPPEVQVEATTKAMAAGVPIIVSGLLPLDWKGHRSGRADLWLRGPDTEAGTPGYYPVMVKYHRALEKQAPGPGRDPGLVSLLTSPLLADAVDVAGVAVRISSREPDLLQLGHYWRLAQAAGIAPAGAPMGGIIGTDQVADLNDHRVVTWIRLDHKLIRTFSRTAAAGWTRRSPLERYDHEHGFRTKVATVARRQDSDSAPALLVSPIRIRECDRCVWWQTCRPQLGDDDLSLRIDKSPLDVREIAVLRRMGIATLADLASIDLDEMLPQYLPEVAHRPGGEERLRVAAHRARLMVAGVELERTDAAPICLPRVDQEIDLDIETSANDRIYLWGFLVSDGNGRSEPSYVQFSDFADLDEDGERHLAIRALAWLREHMSKPEVTSRVYHYSNYEVVRILRLASASDHPVLRWAAQATETKFVDLFDIMRRHFFGTHGLGLKQVAQAGPGFSWRDDNPGGLNSQTWFADAVHSSEAWLRQEARQRVLDYNEDDVRATHALREWLRTLDQPQDTATNQPTNSPSETTSSASPVS